MTTLDVSTEVAQFGELRILWDRRVLRPRPWTTAQSHWAAALSPYCPDGPILELCCGAGQIGLLAASLTGRSLIQVDRDPVAAAYVRRNAAATGIASDVRTAALTDALGDDERFGLVILDPPWVPSAQVEEHPEDPVGAIDGGIDGTDQLVLGLGVALRHLEPGGHAIVQVGTEEQVEIVRALLDGVDGREARWAVLEVRDYRPGGLLLDIGHRT
ncbi:RsmD family RNA methyltransferase [Nocardioides antri]|uniref:Methyltransferase n=1 Tax=Nocardioides antri TaxID=2607659 RepID=A0A5B1LZB3_9ACTN|nr:RsmD family RNA methyltransferase [Nocardioides antri]KAA1425814.1 methyltransferase [Nocardioides antri]